MTRMKFYFCETCNRIFNFIKAPNQELECCGKPLKELVPNSTNASLEKHVPIIERMDSHVEIKVGAEPHPMLPEHYIEWVVLETNYGYQLKNLHPGDAPTASFALSKGEEVLCAYAYCNIHKLWKS